MYNTQLPAYTGSKGSKQPKPHVPVTSPDSLISTSYAKVLIAVAEGELAGQPTARDIFLGGTPLESANGNRNFGGVKWDWRSGTQDQTYIQGIPDVNNEITIGFEITSEAFFSRLITTPNLSAIRINMSFPAIFEQKQNGDVTGYTMQYAIDLSTEGGAYVEYGVYTVSGKASSEYNRSHRVDLPQDATFWDIRVRRVTPNRNDARIGDKIIVKTYTEIIDAKFRYPNTALLYVEFDASLFGGNTIPPISVKTKGRYVRVPTNYDPDNRTYIGIWDGSFKWAYSNNPAWVFYDIVLQDRFGLGSRIDQSQVDKWTLYKVAQYCDVLVSDGRGGLEPRHTCNIYIQSRKEAWAVLRDITSIFNGMIYWDGTQIVANADMPVDITAVRTYNRSMVEGGEFNYSSTSERTIYTTALVSYDDPDNHYETATEPVNEPSLVKRYRTWAQTELSAIGCTSRGEAQRKGKYTMITNGFNRVVTFKLGMDGYLPRPSEVFGVADQLLAGKQFAGRIKRVWSKNQILLDRPVEFEPGDILYINTEDGRSQGRTIERIQAIPDPSLQSYTPFSGAEWAAGSIKINVGSVATSAEGKTPYAGSMYWYAGSGVRVGLLDKPVYIVTTTTDFDLEPEAELGWYIESENVKSQLFRCNKITWNEDSNTFEVIGVEYNDSKYGAVDNGARLEDRPISQIPISAQEQVGTITVDSYTYIEQGLSVTSMTATWDAVPGAVKYECEWRKDGGDWKNVGTIGTTSFDVYGIYTGSYIVRVRAISSFDTKSLWKESLPTQLNGKVGMPPALASFTTTPIIFGIAIDWQFAEGSEDGAYVQIQESNTIDGTFPVELSFVPYPQKSYTKSSMAAGVVRFFRARLVDKSGNEGPWTDWTYGISSADASEILDYITGEITETQLGSDLLEKVNTGGGAAIEIEQVKDGLNAMYSIKLGVDSEGRYYGAGMGIGIENTPAGLQSQVLFVADRFAILNQIDGVVTSPFVVQGGQTIINNAVIGDATIGFAKIDDTIQSTNYVPQVSGWRLWKNGDFEINGSVPGQGRILLNNNGLKVYDNQTPPVVRVQIGNLSV